MNATKSVLIICSILVAALLGGLTARSRVHRQQRETQAQLAARAGDVAALKAALAAGEDTARQLEEKLQRLTGVLLQSTAQLTDARAELERRVVVPQPVAAAPAAPPPNPLPTPLITGTKEEKNLRVIFPELRSKTGQLIAKDQEFSSQFGRNLVFKDAAGTRLRLDVEEVHYGILATLGIDLATAKQEQRDLDAKSAQYNVAAKQAQASYAAAMAQAAKEQKEREVQLAIETAKLNEERRKAIQEENLRQQAVEADRLRSLAALRNADAAMYGALAQPTYFYNNNFNNFNVDGTPNYNPNPPAPSSTVAAPFTSNTVYMVVSNKVQLIRSPKGLPKP